MDSANYCSNCGKPLEEEVNFCPDCGNQIKDLDQGAVNKSKEDQDEDILEPRVEPRVNKISKKWGHLAVGVISFLMLLLGVSATNVLMEGMFGYYTPMMVELMGVVLIGFLVGFVLTTIISVYATKLNLLMFNKDRISWGDIFLKRINFFKNIGSYLSASILIGLINLVILTISMVIILRSGYENFGVVQLITGIILLIINSRLFLSPFVVFDQEKRAVSAIKKSIQLTKNNTFKMIGWIILASIINSIGGAFYVGMFISFPLTIYLFTRAYYNLKS